MLQSLIAYRMGRLEAGRRNVPRDFHVTEALRGRISAQAERSMRWRIPAWGEATMATQER
jgi:hypothetical protein